MEFDRQQFTAALASVRGHFATLGQSEVEQISKPRIDDSQQEITDFDLSVRLFETLPSTNQTLWGLVDRGATPGTVVIATRQTAGRGQWGRQWHSPSGGLYLSLALAPNLPATLVAQLTLCSAWGIAIALRLYRLPVFLKWPNDLLLQGRKLGGILTETRVQEGKITKAVVGVGINWANPVPETGINLQSFLENHAEEQKGRGAEENLSLSTPSLPHSPSPIASLETLAAVTLAGLVFGYQSWQREGIDTLLPSYEKLLTSIGQAIAVEGRPGVVVGVSPTGELRVRVRTYPEIDAPSVRASVQEASEIYIKPGTISLGYG